MSKTKEITNLLQDNNFELLSLELKKPNIFSILNIAQHEIRHSNFLAWLLSLHEKHGFSDLFLKWFLREILVQKDFNSINPIELDNLDLNQCRIYREWHFIDILIKHPKFVVVIENKVFSVDHSRQLKKYREFVERYFKDIPLKVYVYLTPYGNSPLDYNEHANYINISYRTILSNLTKLMDVYGDFISNSVRKYISDYIEIVEEKIMQEGKEIELVRKLYDNHREVLDFIFENKPDRILECAPIFEEIVKEKNYEYVGGNKGLCRFLPEDLKKIMPKTGTGWPRPNNFIFSFEIDYWPKNVQMGAFRFC